MRARPWISMLATVLACRDADRGPFVAQGSGSGSAAPQTARAAMQLACAPGVSSVAALRPQITNTEIGRALDEIALDTWPSARTRLAALAAQHGVSPCALAEAGSGSAATPALPVTLPALRGPGRPDVAGPLVVVSDSQVTFDGAPVVTLDQGRIAKKDLAIWRVPLLAKRAAGALTGPRVRIAFGETTPVATVLPIIASLAVGPFAEVAIVCEQNGERVLLDVDMALGAIDATYALVAKPGTLQLARWSGGRLAEPEVDTTLDGGMGEIMRALAEQQAKGTPIAGGLQVVVIVDPALDVTQLVGLVSGLRTIMTRPVLSPGHP
jgi:hypothetical protein